MSEAQGIKNYFIKAPFMEDIDTHLNYRGKEYMNYSLIVDKDVSFYETFTSGEGPKQRLFTLRGIKEDLNLAQREECVAFFRELTEWVKEKNRAKEFPLGEIWPILQVAVDRNQFIEDESMRQHKIRGKIIYG